MKIPSLPLKPSNAFVKTTLQMGVISAPLGMLLDNQHGLFNVLNYHAFQLTYVLPWDDIDHPILKSALWVPPLFAFAGWIMTFIVLQCDELFNTNSILKNPSIPKVLYSISYFSSQYYLSGLLDHVGVESVYIHLILIITAILGYTIFDSSKAGLVLGLATAISGPATEIGLINTIDTNLNIHLPTLSTIFEGSSSDSNSMNIDRVTGIVTSVTNNGNFEQYTHIYDYNHADIWGICSWIPWVYFLGAAGVGNLARLLYNYNHNFDNDNHNDCCDAKEEMTIQKESL